MRRPSARPPRAGRAHASSHGGGAGQRIAQCLRHFLILPGHKSILLTHTCEMTWAVPPCVQRSSPTASRTRGLSTFRVEQPNAGKQSAARAQPSSVRGSPFASVSSAFFWDSIN